MVTRLMGRGGGMGHLRVSRKTLRRQYSMAITVLAPVSLHPLIHLPFPIASIIFRGLTPAATRVGETEKLNGIRLSRVLAYYD